MIVGRFVRSNVMAPEIEHEDVPESEKKKPMDQRILALFVLVPSAAIGFVIGIWLGRGGG